MRRDPLTLLARWTPWAILAYALCLALLRVNLSAYLEIDESEFVGQVDFRLIYENSHPPLFNWLTRIALELTRWNWAWALAIVKYALLAAFHIFIFDAARRLGGLRAGLLAVAASAFLPQIVWMSTHTLAHSLLTMAGVAATLQAAIALRARAERIDYIWLGVAAAMGALGKYNFYLFAVPFFTVLALDPAFRALLWTRRALWALGVFLLAVGPSMVAAAMELAANTVRLERLYKPNSDLAWLDIEGVGIDGLVTLVIAGLAWAGPCLVVWVAARRWDQAQSRTWRGEREAELLLRKVLLGGLGLFALGVLVADMHRVEERYLTPILAPLPVYLAVAWPLGRAAAPVAALAAALYCAALPGFWAMTTYGKHRFAYPYELVAAQILRAQPDPAPILARRHDDRANLILALDWPGARTPSFQPLGDRALLVWRGRRDAPKGLAPPGWGPAAGIVTVVGPFTNQSGETIVYRFQPYERAIGVGPRP